MLPFCGPNGQPILNGHELIYTNQGLYIGIFYLMLYLLLGIPQAMCLYALCKRKHLKYSCYKLMLMVSVLDMINLTDGGLICGLFSIFNVHHCNAGRVILVLAEISMALWYMYCFISMTLALNRLLEFASRRTSGFLFRGHRAWLWIVPALAYSFVMTFTVHRPYYYYIPVQGELTFYRISEDNTTLLENTHHIVNNIVKGSAIAFTYIIMLIAMRVQLRGTGLTKSLSKLEVMLSIQALIVGVMSVFSSIVYVILQYVPVGDFKLIGPIGQLCWLSIHGVSGYIYLFMNKSIRQAAFELCPTKGLFKKNTTVFVTGVRQAKLA